jgi:hypothetical protein
MVILVVLYTVPGLWILSQPVADDHACPHATFVILSALSGGKGCR